MKNKNRSLIGVLSISLTLGISALSLLTPAEVNAGVVDKVQKKVEKEISDQQLANEYLRKNPQASQYMRDSQQEFENRLKRAKSPKEMARLTKERQQEVEASLKMYADLERRDREIAAMKTRDYSKAIDGEPKGYPTAKRLAAQCGRGENVGYSNYFGDEGFYMQRYPLVGPEFADIEAIPILREKMIPTLDPTIRKFFKDKQLTFTSMELNRRRSSTHSNIHEQGGQKEYSDRILRESGEHHRNRSDNLSEELFEDVFTALKKFRHTYYVNGRAPLSRYQRESGANERTITGTEILSECRYYWAHGNTVKYYDPREDERGGFFLKNRNKDKRIGIEPGMVVADPVIPRGEPLAKQNLVANEYDKQINTRDVGSRASKYQERLGTEDSNESASDIIKRTYGEDFKDPSEFKSLEGGMDTSNGGMSQYQQNRDREGRRSLEGSMVDEFKNGRKKKSVMKLDFDDIYR